MNMQTSADALFFII